MSVESKAARRRRMRVWRRCGIKDGIMAIVSLRLLLCDELVQQVEAEGRTAYSSILSTCSAL